MKRIILLSCILILIACGALRAQTFQLQEIKTVSTNQNDTLEIIITLKEIETGNIFTYGLPKSEWSKSEDEQVQFVVDKFKQNKTLEDQEAANKPAKIKTGIIVQKKNKNYK